MPNSIDQHEVRRLIDERAAQLVEVLPAEEYEQEHIAGAINISLKELTAETADVLDPNRPIIVYCHDYL